MKNSKLLQLLKSLDKDEISRFKKYLTKRHYNNEVTLKILDFILKHYPSFESKNINKDYILVHVLHQEKGLPKRISNEFHKLYKWLLDFLIMEKIGVDDLLRNQIILKIFKERKVDRLYFQKIEMLKKDISNHRESIWKYLNMVLLHHSQYFYAATAKLRNVENLLTAAIESLQLFYQLTMLKYNSEFQNRSNILSPVKMTDGNLWYTPLSLNSTVEKPSFLFSLYQKIYLFTSHPYPELYLELKNTLYSKHQNLVLEDRAVLLTYLINYTIKKINSGEISFVQETFELHEFGFRNAILATSGYLTVDKFRNILIIACELEKSEWSKSFLKEHIEYVPEEHRASLKALGNALILFSKREYIQCIDYLNKVDFKDYGYTLQTKFILLKCYYELRPEYGKTLESFLNSFYNTIRRNTTIHQGTLESYQNSINIIKKLLRVNSRKSQIDVLSEVQSQNYIAGKTWLLKKVEELDQPE